MNGLMTSEESHRRVMGHGGGAAGSVPRSESAAMPLPMPGVAMVRQVVKALGRRKEASFRKSEELWEAWKEKREDPERLRQYTRALRRVWTLRTAGVCLFLRKDLVFPSANEQAILLTEGGAR